MTILDFLGAYNFEYAVLIEDYGSRLVANPTATQIASFLLRYGNLKVDYWMIEETVMNGTILSITTKEEV